MYPHDLSSFLSVMVLKLENDVTRFLSFSSSFWLLYGVWLWNIAREKPKGGSVWVVLGKTLALVPVGDDGPGSQCWHDQILILETSLWWLRVEVWGGEGWL